MEDGVGFGLPGWKLGEQGQGLDLCYDPTAGPWLKTLQGENGGAFTAVDEVFADHLSTHGYTLSESLHITGDVSISDWHEEILTPGWKWETVAMLLIQPNNNFAIPPGFELAFSADDDTVSFFFDPLPPSTQILITKTLAYVGANPAVAGEADFNGVVTVKQYPTIPEPSLILLLGAGLAFERLRRRSFRNRSGHR
jgi:hypothetical protein